MSPAWRKSKESLIRHIELVRKQRTILFSDIVQSTKIWATQGDIQGRLMLDRHNWLLFPVIKKFRGRIIKTIGDAILASFKNPDLAVKAAVAMQQMLAKERASNPGFTLKIRIGLHTGPTIVEQHDVFGDTVNIASRVESQADRSGILLSERTVQALKKPVVALELKSSSKLKGIKDPMDIYHCLWKEAPDLLEELSLPARLALIPQQRTEMLFSVLASLTALVVLWWLYGRYLLGEQEDLALILLNPRLLITDYPLWLVLAVVLAGAAVLAFEYLRPFFLMMLHVLKGGFGFLLMFGLVYGALSLLPVGLSAGLHHPWLKSRHLFVSPVAARTLVYAEPDLKARPLLTVNYGQLLLLADVQQHAQITWNKVLIRKERYGWIPRMLPPALGVAARRVTRTQAFLFRPLDAAALIAGLAGFLWGFLTFRLRPA